MKITFLVLAMLAGCLAGRAQSLPARQVPAGVIAAFQHTFPTAAKPKWRQQETAYEVSFAQAPGESSALFTAAGELLETKMAISGHQLPPLARTAMMAHYPKREIDKFFKIMTASGRVTFAALVCRGKDKDCQTSWFDIDGRPLKP